MSTLQTIPETSTIVNQSSFFNFGSLLSNKKLLIFIAVAVIAVGFYVYYKKRNEKMNTQVNMQTMPQFNMMQQPMYNPYLQNQFSQMQHQQQQQMQQPQMQQPNEDQNEQISQLDMEAIQNQLAS